MAKQFINPNLHVVLVHFPLALLVMGTLIELLAPLFWRRSAFRAGGRWMILLGALTAVPAATAGLYALYDTNLTPDTSPEVRPDVTWAEVRAASPIKGQAWDMMKDHAWFSAFGSAAVLVMVVLWLGSADVWRSRLHLVFLLILLGGVSTILSSAWHGGEMVYRFGVGVGRVQAPTEADQAQTPTPRQIQYYLPPLQTHVILAGTAIAAALAAIGLSLRAGSQARVAVEPTPELADIGAALNPNLRPRVPLAAGGALGTGAFGGYEQAAAMRVTVQRQPVARFWLLAALFAIGTGLTGWWTLAERSDVWQPRELFKLVVDPSVNGGQRRLAHGIATGATVVLLLALALVSRLAVGKRAVFGLFSMLLVVFLAAQLWFGSLLMFDSNIGKLERFNGTSADGSAPATQPTTAPSPSTAPTASL